MAKATRKKAMGRGLAALLSDPATDVTSAQDTGAEKLVGSIVDLDLSLIEANPFQPRKTFNEEALRELGSSIRELGVIQPITVRKVGFNKFQLVSGERRFRASKLVGLTTIPAYIRLADDQQSLTMALVENIQRQDLDPIEVALSYKRLIEEIDLTQEQMSERVGKNRSTITNYLRLLKLDPIVQMGMRDGFISMGHGRALINVTDSEDQLRIYESIIADGLSVRQTEQLVRETKPNTKASGLPTRKTASLPQDFDKELDKWQFRFNTPIKVKPASNGGGSIQIKYTSPAELERIAALLRGE